MTYQFDPPKIVAMRVYPSGDAVMIRAARRVNGGIGGRKKPLIYLSAKSRTRMLFMLRNTDIRFRSMFCLTYPATFPLDGAKVKSHLNAWLTWYRRSTRGVPYFWFLEFQARGAPHVHIYLAAKVADLPGREMAIAWAAQVSGDDQDTYTKVLAVHQHKSQLQDFLTRDGSIRYAAKYALKTTQKFVPESYRNVGRFWGASRVVMQSVPDGDLVPVTDRAIEEYLYQTEHRCQKYEFVPKVIFCLFADDKE